LPVEDESLLDRRVLAVKIDNHPQARPQSGLQEAEAVYEIPVEHTFTRFMALFHTTDSAYVGPIRSARPTDRTLVIPLDASFQHSGAKVWVEGLLAASGVHQLPPTTSNTFRIPTRVAPHNLYGLTQEMRALADARGYPDNAPPPLFDYEPGIEIAGESVGRIDFSDSSKYGSTNWRWDGEHYLRFVGDTPHWWINIESEQGQIASDVLVVIVCDEYTASPSDPSAGSSLPAYDTVGSGQVFVFAQGTLVEGTWARTTMEEPFLLRDRAGSVLSLPPGNPWIAIFPSYATLSWSE
jgi:hypothetical protein